MRDVAAEIEAEMARPGRRHEKAAGDGLFFAGDAAAFFGAAGAAAFFFASGAAGAFFGATFFFDDFARALKSRQSPIQKSNSLFRCTSSSFTSI